MYLFVYGTLRKGCCNHRVLGDAKFIEEGSMQGKMISLGGFPGMVDCDELCAAVHGEVYEVADFSRLDALEGYDSESHRGMYLRELRPYFSEREAPDGFTYGSIRDKVHVYLWNGNTEGRRVIEDGVWRE